MANLARREWLQGVAGTLLAQKILAAPRDRATPKVPFAFSLYGMRNLKTSDALRTCADIGYDGVELALLPGYATEPKCLSAPDRRELRQRLDDTGLTLVGLMVLLSEPAEVTKHQANLDFLKTAAELGQTLSPKVPTVIETVLGGQPTQWDKVKDRLAERLRSWAEVAAAAKTVVAVKAHVSNALHTPEGANWLIERVNSPWLKLAFDYSHFALRDFPLEKTVKALLPQSVFIHVKDARGNAGKFDFLLPGEGTTDYPAYFQAIKAASYQGPIVVEVSGQISGKPGYDPVAAAKKSYANLAPILEKVGLRVK